MSLKLDENLGRAVQQVFVAAGHDVETALSERLSGADDQAIFTTCCREGRCLVTMDLDFSDPIRFCSRDCGGIVVLRTSGRSSRSLLESLAGKAMSALNRMRLDGGLWIVEPGGISVHQREGE